MSTNTLNGRLQLTSLESQVTPAEWQARIDLAACYRLVAHYGMSDMMANHITLRVPGEPDAFLTNPYGMMYDEMSASCLVKIDHRGKLLIKPDFGELDYTINIPGFILHSAVHEARPEVNCVIHTHTPAGMLPTFIFHLTVCVFKSIAASSLESCKVMKAIVLSDVNATCEGAFDVGIRFTNLKLPS
jgi:ribulose-5-phosphate 4-epimerase/fuculose-1-phosphate aldolase